MNRSLLKLHHSSLLQSDRTYHVTPKTAGSYHNFATGCRRAENSAAACVSTALPRSAVLARNMTLRLVGLAAVAAVSGVIAASCFQASMRSVSPGNTCDVKRTCRHIAALSDTCCVAWVQFVPLSFTSQSEPAVCQYARDFRLPAPL